MIPILHSDGTRVVSFSSPPSWIDEVRRQGLKNGVPEPSAPITWADLIAERHHDLYGRPWILGRITVDELIRRGIPRDKPLLDIGCGSGRMGALLAEYLDPDMYCGLDCHLGSLVAFAAYEALLMRLSLKRPRLMFDQDFAVDAFGVTFNTVIDFAVTVHLGPKIAAKAYEKIRSVTNSEGRAFITQRTALDASTMKQIGFTLIDERIVRYNLPVTDAGPLGEDLWFEFQAS